ncbi:hypothetical protein BpHYR1_048335 [Brachionus plicatilis]|uniref:HTH psq-type domain-containing protein n=1 Tax=Brachionus plicatilis TaxID=10195 RepID=A0A3M7PDT3_BRAPC|nr:hypothetical protein BpHYR1_048335 [Brachionus plicatilis]
MNKKTNTNTNQRTAISLERRIEILDQLAKGKDNKSVAEFLSIDLSTIAPDSISVVMEFRISIV